MQLPWSWHIWIFFPSYAKSKWLTCQCVESSLGLPILICKYDAQEVLENKPLPSGPPHGCADHGLYNPHNFTQQLSTIIFSEDLCSSLPNLQVSWLKKRCIYKGIWRNSAIFFTYEAKLIIYYVSLISTLFIVE